MHLIGRTVRFIHLVYHNNRLLSKFQRLLQHETRLRHGAFKSINQDQHSIGHVEHALNLTAKVAVAGGINDVDFYSFIPDGNIL